MSIIKSAIIKKMFVPYFLLKNKDFRHTILMYHGITHNRSSHNKRHQLTKDFIEHLKFLKNYCHVISLEDFFNQNFKPGKINVALTFDDGYWNNYSIAKPLLEEFEVPAHFYITGINENNNLNETIPPILWADLIEIAAHLKLIPTAFKSYHLDLINQKYIDQTSNQSIQDIIKNSDPEFSSKLALYNTFTKDQQNLIFNQPSEFWELMNEKEIIETSRSKWITIGSHGYYHNNIGKLPTEIMKEEILTSKNYLENLIQKPINSIAYPDGSYSIESKKYCNEIGINYQLATDNYLFQEDVSDKNILKRSGIYDVGHYNNQLFNALKY
jgi:peptidoglycan/xylan/chitin deacetylase (PgdA/CDA1 family)